MSFSASWLALREPHDHAARAPLLTDRLGAFLAAQPPATIRFLDLACGSGSTLRYLAPRVGGPQQWLMVDNDEALLTLLPDSLAGESRGGVAVGVQPIRCDLATDLDRLPWNGVDVVTASALLDLVSDRWLQRLVRAIAPDSATSGMADAGAARPALLLSLSYDGAMRWQPALPDDDGVTALFNRHQRMDKGFGPALGPAGADAAARRLRDAGFAVQQAASPWQLGAGDRVIQREMTGGMAAALAASFPQEAPWLQRWRDTRMALIDAGKSAVRVGHTDLLALPAGAPGS